MIDHELNADHFSTPYTPVLWVYREIIDEQIQKQEAGRIFYFCHHEGIREASGSILKIEEFKDKGVFILLSSEIKIRIDRIITLFRKPGAAYDEYDAYANACMSCREENPTLDFLHYI